MEARCRHCGSPVRVDAGPVEEYNPKTGPSEEEKIRNYQIMYGRLPPKKKGRR